MRDPRQQFNSPKFRLAMCLIGIALAMLMMGIAMGLWRQVLDPANWR